MSNHIIKFWFIALFTVFFISCDEDFLEEVPTTAVAASSATESTENLFLVINGIHRLMYERQGSNGRGGYNTLMIQHDMLGDDLVMNARANGWFVNTARWLDHTNPQSTNTRHGWRVMYKVIANANVIIEGAEMAAGPNEQRMAAVGQALAYRAFAHFLLVQRHAIRYDAGGMNSQPGIPLILSPTTEGVARATVEEVYAQINADLDAAITNLEGYERPNKSHIDQSVARGIQARVALVQGNWDQAADLAVQAREGYTLMDTSTYQSGFNDYTIDEWMWGGFYNEEQGSAFTNFGAYMSRNFSSSNIRGNPKSISSTLYNTIPSTDVRSTIFSADGSHPNLPAGVEISSRHSRFPYTNQKFLAFGTGDSRSDVPYMRSAEMYLIEAEAKARSGDDDGAADALFTLASARDTEYDEASDDTGDDLVEEILLQRRWELWGEGFRYLDLKRNNLPLDRTGSNHVPALLSNLLTVDAGDDRWQWQIPQAEIDANDLITQNP